MSPQDAFIIALKGFYDTVDQYFNAHKTFLKEADQYCAYIPKAELEKYGFAFDQQRLFNNKDPKYGVCSVICTSMTDYSSINVKNIKNGVGKFLQGGFDIFDYQILPQPEKDYVMVFKTKDYYKIVDNIVNKASKAGENL